MAAVTGSDTKRVIRLSNYRVHYIKGVFLAAAIKSDMRKDVRPLVTDYTTKREGLKQTF